MNGTSEMTKQEILDCLDSMHHKILKDKIAEKISEEEMIAFVKAKDIIRELVSENCRSCSRRKWYQIGYKEGCNAAHGVQIDYNRGRQKIKV